MLQENHQQKDKKPRQKKIRENFALMERIIFGSEYF